MLTCRLRIRVAPQDAPLVTKQIALAAHGVAGTVSSAVSGNGEFGELARSDVGHGQQRRISSRRQGTPFDRHRRHLCEPRPPVLGHGLGPLGPSIWSVFPIEFSPVCRQEQVDEKTYMIEKSAKKTEKLSAEIEALSGALRAQSAARCSAVVACSQRESDVELGLAPSRPCKRAANSIGGLLRPA